MFKTSDSPAGLKPAQQTSLALTATLCGVLGLLFLVQPWWPAFAHWQTGAAAKTVTGYLMVFLMAALWLQSILRRHLSSIHWNWLKVTHQWIGLGLLFVFLLHANLVRQGYLALLTAALLLTSLAGATVAYTQLREVTRGRRWILASHIVGASVVTAAVVLHLYFAYAYAGA